MSVTLAITGSDLCGDAAFSAALCADGELSVAAVPSGQRGDLATLCRDLCASRDVDPSGIDKVIVDVGPGSYTGLRVAVTFVRLLGQFSSLKVEGVCSLAVLARHVLGNAEGSVRTLLDARRGRLHTALHRHEGGCVREIEKPRAVAVEDVLAGIRGDHVVAAPPALAAQLQSQYGVSCSIATGWTAAALLVEGLPRFSADATALEPRYLMASYAES